MDKNISRADLVDYIESETEVFGSEIIFQENKKSENKSNLGEKILDNNQSKDWTKSRDLISLNKNICDCMECPLGETRNEFVFGSGNPNADILVIGEAPGADEDKQGLPFVGRAGKLLTKILEAINLSRDEVFIANIIKCRPPGNRRPEKIEIEKCEPYLKKQIELIDPMFILALGKTAVDTLLKKNHTMKDVRGKFTEYEGRKMMVTYHPAALLRNPNWKRPVWEDVQLLRKAYDQELALSK